MSLWLWFSVVSSSLLPCSGSCSCGFRFLVLLLAGGLWLCLWSRLFLCSFLFSKVSRADVPGSRAYLTNGSLPDFSLASLSSDACNWWLNLPHRLISFWQCSCIHGQYQSLIAVILAIFLFHKGPLIFFLCKGSPSVIRQVPVAGSLSRHKIGSSLPHFLLSGHVLKKMGYSANFPCDSLSLHDCFLLALDCT